MLIHCPLKFLFLYTEDFEHEPEWAPTALYCKRLSNIEHGVGVQFDYTYKILCFKHKTIFEISEYEPNQYFLIKSLTGPIPYAIAYRYKALSDNTTKIILETRAEVKGILLLMKPLLEHALKHDMHNYLEAMRKHLEKTVVNLKQVNSYDEKLY